MRRKQLSDVMTIRLPYGIRSDLQAEANYRGTSVAELIRQRLDSATATIAIARDIRAELQYFIQRGLGGQAESDRSNSDALLAEVLLILRQIVSPAQMRSIQNEVHELGFEIWTGGQPR